MEKTVALFYDFITTTHAYTRPAPSFRCVRPCTTNHRSERRAGRHDRFRVLLYIVRSDVLTVLRGTGAVII